MTVPSNVVAPVAAVVERLTDARSFGAAFERLSGQGGDDLEGDAENQWACDRCGCGHDARRRRCESCGWRVPARRSTYRSVGNPGVAPAGGARRARECARCGRVYGSDARCCERCGSALLDVAAAPMLGGAPDGRPLPPASTAVANELARLGGESPTELDPIYGVVDPDALDALVRSLESGVVTFPYGRYEVTVTAEGRVLIDDGA